jgi:hypothetical protein
MSVKSLAKVVAGLACCLGNAAQATIVTYTYEARVGYMVEMPPLNAPWVDVAQSNFAGTPVAIDDILIGSFQYDTSVNLRSQQSNAYPGLDYRLYEAEATDYIRYVDKNTGLAAAASRPYAYGPWPTEVLDGPGDWPADRFSMSRYVENDVMSTVVDITFSDWEGSSWHSAAIPVELNLASFQYAAVGSTFRNKDGAAMIFYAYITSLERVDTEVPEPSSALLFAIAAGGLFSLRKMRRA